LPATTFLGGSKFGDDANGSTPRPAFIDFGAAGRAGRPQQIWIVTRLRDPNTAEMNFTKNIGMLLLAIYLIIAGLIALFSVAIPPVVTGILALAAGVLILIGK
jgi:hypothetical protein